MKEQFDRLHKIMNDLESNQQELKELRDLLPSDKQEYINKTLPLYNQLIKNLWVLDSNIK